MKLSVITITKDNLAGLTRTLVSLQAQRDTHYEWIVVDGASVDGTVQLLKNSVVPITKWISEPDLGIYDAMNKAVLMATGDFCLFLNAGDSLLRQDSLSDLIASLDENYEVLFSDLIYEQDGHRRRRDYPVEISSSFFISNTLNHQNCAICRKLLLTEPYRTDFKVASDWFFFAKVSLEYKARFKKVAEPISLFDNSGWSASSVGTKMNSEERDRGLAELFGSGLPIALELVTYRDSVYGNIVRNFGESWMLTTLLRIYRVAMRILFPRKREHLPSLRTRT